MRLDVFSDTVCPWCYVGKRRLERALAQRPEPALQIRWRAFQLNPGMPADGMDRRAYIDLKFGGSDRASRIHEAVMAVGAAEGIEFRFDRIRRTPNTLDSHRLLRLAAAHDRQDAVLEELFRRYFIDGEDIGDREVLVAAAGAAGMPPGLAGDLLASGDETEATLAEDLLARRQGINGVPCFIFNGRFAMSGAQDPEALFQLLDLAREDDTMQRQAGVVQ